MPIGDSGVSGGGFGGANVRIGAQINHLWSVYYQGAGLIGGYGLESRGETGVTVFAGWFNSFLGGVTVGHMLDIGFGPSIDSIAALSASADTEGDLPSASAGALAGTGFGMHARAALLLGGWNPSGPRRKGFAIALDFHPTFLDGRALLLTSLSLGREWY